jgi:hypothetical protein
MTGASRAARPAERAFFRISRSKFCALRAEKVELGSAE